MSKVTANPFAATAITLATTDTAKITLDTATVADWKLLKTFNVYVVGQSDAAKEPTKGLATWISSSAALRKTNAVDVSSNVSSYAIIVDVTTKKALADYPVYCGTSGTTKNSNVAGTPSTACTVGATGSSLMFWFNNGTTTTTVINAFGLLNSVTKNGVAAVAAAGGAAAVVEVLATFGPVLQTWSAAITSGKTITAYATAQTDSKTQILTFTTMLTCDIAKWDSATACDGVDKPWAHNTFTDYVSTGTVAGSFKAWHFLAEKGADVAQNFQLEKDNKLNWIV